MQYNLIPMTDHVAEYESVFAYPASAYSDNKFVIVYNVCGLQVEIKTVTCTIADKEKRIKKLTNVCKRVQDDIALLQVQQFDKE